jgi:hypothetical protein
MLIAGACTRRRRTAGRRGAATLSMVRRFQLKLPALLCLHCTACLVLVFMAHGLHVEVSVDWPSVLARHDPIWSVPSACMLQKCVTIPSGRIESVGHLISDTDRFHTGALVACLN